MKLAFYSMLLIAFLGSTTAVADPSNQSFETASNEDVAFGAVGSLPHDGVISLEKKCEVVIIRKNGEDIWKWRPTCQEQYTCVQSEGGTCDGGACGSFGELTTCWSSHRLYDRENLCIASFSCDPAPPGCTVDCLEKACLCTIYFDSLACN